MSTIPAYTIGGLTRPELHLDPTGHIILDPAAQAFADTHGLQYLYLGCPPGTLWPPVQGFLAPPTDANSSTNTVVEGAAANTSVGITAQSSSLIGLPVTYSLTSDSSHGGFKVDPNTGVISVADPTKVDFESSGGSYIVNVQATDGIFASSQSFVIAVSNAPPSTPVDSNAAANAVNEGAAVNTLVGITASSADVNGPGVTYSLTGDTSGGGFKIDPNTGVVTVADSTKLDFETAPGHAYTITVQASDGHGGFSSQSFTINVNDVPVSTPVDTNPAANSVVEGAAVNTLVGITASAVDPNGPATTYSLTGDTSGGGFKIDPNTAHAVDINGPAVTYSLTGDTSGGGFAIDPATGIITVADPTKINYESAPGHAYTVTATASDGTLASSQTFTIGVTNAPPSAPVDADANPNAIAEGAANGSTVGVTASAIDVNGPPVTYSLVGDTSGGGFTIDATTGVVTVADGTKIDYESAPGHAYTITAQASDGQGGTSTQSFTIAVTDVAPSTPVDSDVGANTVVEGAAAGSTVGITASAIDVNGPAVTYSLVGDTSGGGFTINAATGVVTVADPTKIDYETSGAGHSYTITAQASDGTLSSSQTFTIAVSDAAPSIPVDSNAAANSVVEGAAAGSTVGVTVSSTDVNGPAVTYSLTGDTSGGGFTINATTGVITVADPTKIDYESSGPTHSYAVTAQASDGTLTSSQTFTIAVADAPPSTPVDADATPNSIAEGAAAGSTVGITASSTDVNGPAVTYSLIGDTSGGGFTINAATGVISVADSTKIDYESAAGHAYTVTAQASDGTLASSQTFTIAVTDVAPSTPVDSDGAINRVAVGAPVGSGTGVTASSTDVNGPAVTYSLVGDTSGGAFTINAATGKVTVADPTKIVFNPASPSYDITVDSSDGTLHSQQTFTIGVVIDAAPVVTAGHTLNYTENQVATVIDSAITVTDSDNATLDHATVQITDHYVSGEDVLAFVNTATITGTFNAATGTLTLTGTDSVANYQAALASVTYFNTSDNPSGLARTVTITANDGTLDSTPVTDTINVTPVNDPPVVTAGHTLNYTENQVATAFDPAITVIDVDNTTLAGATVQITGNYANGQDVLGFTTIGNITGTFDAATGKLTLTGTDTVANYQAALASVTYFNISDNPSGLARTVTITANDGAANSTAVTDTIHVTPVNDPPVTSAGGTLNYIENQAATAIDTSVNVSDVDSANMASATVAITGGFAAGQDVLGFNPQNGIIGSYNALTGVLTLTGSSSVANYKAALDSITYFNTSDNPSGADRTVSFTVNDGSLDSNTSTSTIHVTPVNDAPVISFGAIAGFTEPPNGTPAASSTPVTITPNLTISDAEGNNLTDATFVLNDLKPSDALSIAGHAGTSGDIGGIHFDITSIAGTETISFTGTDTLAHYNAALDQIQFNNTSENPDTTARSYTLTVHDDGGTANGGNNTGTASTTGSVTAVNDAPTATVPADNSIGTAFSHTNLAISGLSVADVDAGSGNVTATIASNHAALSFDTTGLASFTNNASHTVTLTGTTAQVNTALATLTYNSDEGFTGSDTVTLNVNDNGNTGTPGAQTSGAQTFHVGVVPQVFYIDNSTTGTSLNLGTQHDPYTSIAAFNAANPAGSGDYVVLEHGTGTYSEANGINLASGVNLIGGSHTLTFTNPVTNATVTANVGSGTDPVIHVTGADNGIDLLGTSGHTITGVSIDTSASTGIGISDDGNNVGTVTMSDITVKTASGAGLSFTHGGTITVTGSNNTITSTIGTALDVEHTNIGAGNLTFKSISATGSSGNAGIILDTTGTAGGLTVTGTGSAGSGGTINNKTGGDILSGTDAGGQTTSGDGGTGIFLHSTANVSLTDMTLHDFSNFAIYGNGVTNFTLANSAISGTNGTTNAGDREESSIRFDNLLGTASITGSSISGGFTQNVDLYNTSGTLNRLTMDSDTFGLIGSSGNDNVLGQVYNSATANYTVTNSTFAGTRSDFIAFAANNNSSMDAVVRSNTFHNGQAIVPGGGTAVHIASGSGGLVSAATTTFDISHNILTDGGTNAFDTVGIFVSKGQDNGTMSGTIASNDIGPAKVGSNSDGIFVRDAGAGSLTTLIQNNTITGVGDAGIALQNNDGSSTLNATLYGNSVSSPTSASPFAALDVENGATATDTSTTNVAIGMGSGGTGSKNTLNHSALYATDVELSNFGASTHLNLSKNGSTSGNAAGVITDDNTSTTGGITVDTTGGNGTTTLVSTLPTLPAVVAPLLAEAGGVQASTPNAGETHLTQAELSSVVSAAIAEWASAGANATQLALLHAATFSIADLAGQIVGQEGALHITIDTDAAGHGWFIDPTPSDNFEFTHAVNAAGTDLLTDPSTAAAGHLDLLTTVVHELGHVLGLPDSISPSDASSLMYIGLADGERRLATTSDVAQSNAALQKAMPTQGTATSNQQTATLQTTGTLKMTSGDSFDFSSLTQTQSQTNTNHVDVATNTQTLSDLFSGQSSAATPWWVGHEMTYAAMGDNPTDHLQTHHDLVV
ncbi:MULTISPECIES: cadherin repeat domain-containing protein [unclassified Bradyrhizobium]|uniref:beta strand repeat-containing protein n=1 Tax=unclassified Bradyrhizobium TaxID=2631580 RepID=UPI001BA6B416|nr:MULTISPECIES: cadherin repeat domain-containing protein [unclassified Bradyrhizobium]MBR1205935.1 cadherin domain-containing protein [Bradyrhizobium sp. AUGA SZCCT0124]MBR1314938.1 cadherin domain-containing protein [Bradyrhizobium sp. AUGA SZCCT0051]MBR1341909.1 cadherin domain-containing protein [Bradyrhizobium sp. AUGA SZCCT0105]MBR1358689.1 cadherin domain-containing protein [Bradyrhizobium sp. AUGA SZCCT0045]